MNNDDTYRKIENAIRPHLYKYEEPWLKRAPMIRSIMDSLYPGHNDIGEYGNIDHRDWRDDEIAKLREEYDKKQQMRDDDMNDPYSG